MKLTVNADRVTRVWPRVEVWQNSTLRYSPPPDFPRYLAAQTGRAKLMRCWITLDEYWDYKTGEFYPDYDIGVKRYPDEELHYLYDWKNIVPAPSGTRFRDYLTSHAAEADEVMLNVRRLERETCDGIISYDKYEEILERAVEYCKELAPNIRYVECCNEVEIRSFGNLTVDEYYALYRRACRAVARLNARHGYELPLQIGGWAKLGIIDHFDMWEDFLSRLAAETDPDVRCDFYSLHHYDLDCTVRLGRTGECPPMAEATPTERYRFFLYQHRRLLKRVGLEEKPIFIDEMGYTRTTGVPTDSLKNASGVLWQLIASSDTGGMHLFPWCTFHNPKLQISFTQFLLLPDGSYAPTPNGNALILMHRLEKNQLEATLEGAEKYTAAACRGDGENAGRVTVLMTNPKDRTDDFEAVICGLPEGTEKVRVTEYLVDSYRNNRVTGEQVTELHPTRRSEAAVIGGTVSLCCTAEPYAFVMWEIELS